MPRPIVNKIINNTYICTGCKSSKSIEEFGSNKSKKEGLNIYCRKCTSIMNKTSRENIKKGIRKFEKVPYKKGTKEYNDHNKSTMFKYKYGITLNDYNNLFIKQKGCCDICGIHQGELTRSLGIDHNHNTGRVRGLLCTKCNTGLGHFNENVNILHKSIKYLEKYEVIIDDAVAILAGDIESLIQYQREEKAAEKNN